MRGHVNKVEKERLLLLLPSIVPHPVSLRVTVIIFYKNEITIILFTASMMITSVI